MYQSKIIFLLFYICSSIVTSAYNINQNEQGLDVVSYHLTIEPEIQEGYIKGTETIIFRISPKTSSITLQCGNLKIDKVTGANVIAFEKNESRLIIFLSEGVKGNNQVAIEYHGNPVRGLLFNSELDQAYTAYFTGQWMVCNDIPSDKATLSINILIPKEMKCIASGELISVEEKGNKILYHLSQQFEAPTYTYGFAIGYFNEESEKQGDVHLNYYSQNFSSSQLKKVFRETGNMLQFFEEKSGVKYDQGSYSQILIGNHYQEMSGFSVLKNIYGNLVLEDSTETNLIAHELAHQWWGNRITCESWNHFWLNEAFATYMSAAFNEYRFGTAKYESDIESYFRVYQVINKRGNDKSLVFKDWANPTRDDRDLVYFKGAYILHLLRQELGDEAFWNGIKSYSQKYFGKSVSTIDFQNAMQESTNRNLDAFFNEWIYKKER